MHRRLFQVFHGPVIVAGGGTADRQTCRPCLQPVQTGGSPVACGVANTQKYGLVLLPCFLKSLFSPWVPVHLQEVWKEIRSSLFESAFACEQNESDCDTLRDRSGGTRQKGQLRFGCVSCLAVAPDCADAGAGKGSLPWPSGSRSGAAILLS